MSVKCVLRCFAVGSVSLAFGAVDPLDALVGIFEHAPVTLQAPDRTSQAAGAIVQRLGAQGPGVSPHAGAALDPDSHHARAACDKTFLNNARCCFRRPVWASAPRPRLTWGLAPAAFKVSMACRRLRKSVGRNCVLLIGHAWNVVGISRRFARATGFRTVGPNASRLRHTLGRALRQ